MCISPNTHAQRSRARPAYYLTPARLGALVGFAVQRGPVEMDTVLRSLGIVARTNKHGYRVEIDGETTNVSYSRFVRLWLLTREACKHDSSPAIPLLLRFLWQTATTKQDVLTFLDALDSYRPVFAASTESSWG